MAKIIFETRDLFSFNGGWGVVIAEDTAVIVTGVTLYTVERGTIPDDALPADRSKIPYAVKLTLEGVLALL